MFVKSHVGRGIKHKTHWHLEFILSLWLRNTSSCSFKSHCLGRKCLKSYSFHSEDFRHFLPQQGTLGVFQPNTTHSLWCQWVLYYNTTHISNFHRIESGISFMTVEYELLTVEFGSHSTPAHIQRLLIFHACSFHLQLPNSIFSQSNLAQFAFKLYLANLKDLVNTKAYVSFRDVMPDTKTAILS